MIEPRHTARGIIIRGDEILLIERFRGDLHYFSVPGGGIEAGEVPEETVAREITEETSCLVAVQRPLYVLQRGNVRHHIFLCNYVSGDAHLPPDSPEALHGRPDNRFIPRWLPLADLAAAPFLIWQPIQEQLLRDLQHGFADEVVEIVTEPTA